MLVAIATLAAVLTLPAREPAAALFTVSRSQTTIEISTWTGCNAAVYQQQVLALSPVAYLRMHPNVLAEPDIAISGGSWLWSSSPASVNGALSCDANPAAAVTAATILSSEGTDAVQIEGAPFSYVLWVKATAGASGVVFSSAAGLAATGASARADRALFLRSDGTLAVALSDGPVTAALTTTVVITDGQWHQVAVALKTTDIGSTRGTRIYIDGVIRGYDSQMRKGSPPATGESWRVGPAALDSRLGALLPTGTFTGAVDDLAVWNRTLTDSEVATLWAARTG